MIDMNKGNHRKLNTQEQAFVQSLYSSHFKALLNYARRLGFADEVAEDYVQETFLIAMQRVEVVMECRDPRSYLFKILKNRIGYNLRQMRVAKKMLKKLQDQNAGTHTGSEYSQELDPETLYLGAISKDELELLIQFYQEGRSSKEIAADLGINFEACKKRVLRAREHLNQVLREIDNS